jgi:hypothetical protein
LLTRNESRRIALNLAKLAGAAETGRVLVAVSRQVFRSNHKKAVLRASHPMIARPGMVAATVIASPLDARAMFGCVP